MQSVATVVEIGLDLFFKLVPSTAPTGLSEARQGPAQALERRQLTLSPDGLFEKLPATFKLGFAPTRPPRQLLFIGLDDPAETLV